VDEILPVEDSEDLLIVGEFAEKPRFAGGGSSHVTPTVKDDILSHFKKAKYAKGYVIDDDDSDNSLIREATTAAKKAKKVILFIGLPDSIECESFDREDIRIPENQLDLVYALCMQNRNLAVVLFNGSPVDVSWEASAKAILEMYLPGQGGGTAIFNLLTGKANPCGLLAESFPEELSHNPSYLNFPLSVGKKNSVVYAEGENVGYRYYRKKSIDTVFRFGEGLSYSSFSYSDFKIDKSSDDKTKVSFTIKNDGPYDGKKTILLFVESLAFENEFRAELEHVALRKFQKIFLKNGESKEITFYLGKRDFSEYDLASKRFEIYGGKYAIRIQTTKKESSSPLSETLTLPPSFVPPLSVTQNTCWEELLENEGTRKITKPIFDELRAREMKDAEEGDAEGITVAMREAMLKEAPLRLLRNLYGFSQEKLDSFINELREAAK
jgi:beta-glucosidase